MEELCEFTEAQLYERLKLSENQFIEWFRDLKLLHSTRKCVCNSNMILRTKKGKGYQTWQCTRKVCRKERGFFTDTFFEGMHLTLKQVFQLSYFWTRKNHNFEEIKFQLISKDKEEISCKTIVDWNTFFRGFF